jgi:hypothetical protein
MTKILIAGLDGSLRNFGVARLWYDIEAEALDVDDLVLSETLPEKHKKVRASSDLFRRAYELQRTTLTALGGSRMCFAEIPSGGQSYDAVIGFGIVIGVYASINIPLIEVSPIETKKATVGTRTASKQEMIDWAFETYPNAPWLTTKRAGKRVPTLKNEHLADACAIVHAGIRTPAFGQAIAMLRATLAQAA